jgi:hypothetical protein
MIMERIAELLPASQRGVYAAAVDATAEPDPTASATPDATRTPTATKA